MNKQGIQKEIDQANLDIDATNQRISKLREEIAEAEPKRQHGDFGVGHPGSNWLVVQRHDTLEVFGDECGSGEKYKHLDSDFILGNIFNLLKNDEFLEMIATLKKKQS